MEAISPNIFLEKNAIGLFAGLVHTTDGCLQIDANFHPQDMPCYRISGEKNRNLLCFLVSLDTNYDRVLSTKGSDCITITHSNAATTGRVKTTAKSQDEQMTFLDLHETPTSRWVPPEILYHANMTLWLADIELRFEHHAGSNQAGTWVIIPQDKIAFVGDSVLVNQSPFLAYSNLAAWEEDLKLLQSKAFKDYRIISSRSGIVEAADVQNMSKLIGFIRTLIEPLDAKKSTIDEYHALIPKIMKKFELTPNESELFFNRLRWGLSTYFEQIAH
ncbi:MAG: hypothetical protein VB108_10725 [Anaerolineaceae bacterium]|nr:hypothetical protein [Anaerolineaceae bacterium]